MQYRLSAKLPVFISSNFSLVQLLDALTLQKDETNRMKAGRLIQRFKDLMHYVKLSEEPYSE
jgi:primosomal protein DnaI